MYSRIYWYFQIPTHSRVLKNAHFDSFAQNYVARSLKAMAKGWHAMDIYVGRPSFLRHMTAQLAFLQKPKRERESNGGRLEAFLFLPFFLFLSLLLTLFFRLSLSLSFFRFLSFSPFVSLLFPLFFSLSPFISCPHFISFSLIFSLSFSFSNFLSLSHVLSRTDIDCRRERTSTIPDGFLPLESF
jgi:hypothetical protein